MSGGPSRRAWPRARLQRSAADVERCPLQLLRQFCVCKPGFPLSDVPLQTIADQVAAGRYKAKPVRVFRLEDIREAHRVMESNQAGGKMVVLV